MFSRSAQYRQKLKETDPEKFEEQQKKNGRKNHIQEQWLK